MAIHEYDGLGGELESMEWLTQSGRGGVTNLEDLAEKGKLAWVPWTKFAATKCVKHLEILKKAAGTERASASRWGFVEECKAFKTFIAKVETLKKLEERKIEIRD